MSPENSSIVFRTCGNHRQGMGDVQGVVALATEFQQRGWRVSILAEVDETTVKYLRGVGLHHVSAHGEREDREVVHRLRPRAMVFNMLRNAPEYVAAFCNEVDVLVTIDDDGPAAPLADLRINVLYPTRDSYCDPAFVPLKESLQSENRRNRTWKERVESLIVTMGGSDTYGLTPRVVRALGPLAAEMHVEVILGPAYEHWKELEEALGVYPEGRWNVQHDVTDLPRRMSEADLGVCSGGLTLFEMACVGTPAVVVCGEPFEAPTAFRLEQSGFGRSLGFSREISVARVRETVMGLSGQWETREEMGKCGRRLVDGQGAVRCCEEIIRRCMLVAQTS